MNKTERQLAIILELQKRKVLKGEELAEKLETSLRTIYRDIQALSESGVPIIGAPGQGYSLIEGYFLPPISFTVEESVSLLIGADFIEQQFDSHYSKSARSARGKIEVILPRPIRTETERIRSITRLRLQSENSELGERERANISVIRTAMLEGKKIHFKYTKQISQENQGLESVRTAAPLGLVLVQQGWLLIAQCDLRGAHRHFKISRMSDVLVTNDHFEVPTDFDLTTYRPPDERKVVIKTVFKTEVADKVTESRHYFMEHAELRSEGYFVSFRVRFEEELLQWILSWGPAVEVLEPLSFRTRVQKEIELMLKNY